MWRVRETDVRTFYARVWAHVLLFCTSFSSCYIVIRSAQLRSEMLTAFSVLRNGSRASSIDLAVQNVAHLSGMNQGLLIW